VRHRQIGTCIFHVTASHGVSISLTITFNVSCHVIISIFFSSLVMLLGDDKHVTDDNKRGYSLKIEKHSHNTCVEGFLIPM
jgi:hypothetical protein